MLLSLQGLACRVVVAFDPLPHWFESIVPLYFSTNHLFVSLFCVLFGQMWSKESSTAVSVSTFIFLLFLWFFVSMPLVFVGSYFGFRAETYSIPVRVNQIARCVQQKGIP